MPAKSEKLNQSCFCRLLSKSTDACVTRLTAKYGECNVHTVPSVADARFMVETSPAEILRLITRLQRDQVTPASPRFLLSPSALAAALDLAARGAPF